MSHVPRLIVSACLCGQACRYDGVLLPDAPLSLLASQGVAIPVCPELLGGLPVPRPPSEILGDCVFNCHGEDVTEAYKKGAFAVLDLAKKYGIHIAVFKERSPSCASASHYDGSFSGRLVSGEGVTTKILRQNGITVFSEETVPYSLLRNHARSNV